MLGWRFAGTHVSTGEEVGIKLGGAPKPLMLTPACLKPLEKPDDHIDVDEVRCSCCVGEHPDAGLCFAESVKTKHPQLLYESKLYKIMQGGSTPFAVPARVV